MALIKVLIIFVVILALLNKSLPLYLAMIFGSLLMIVMFRLPLATAGAKAAHTPPGRWRRGRRRCTRSRAGTSGR